MTSLSDTPTAMRPHPAGWFTSLNTTYHRTALMVYLGVVIAHWIEHIVQAIQIWILDIPTPKARGALGQLFPWLIRSEWLHYGYALIMLIGLVLLRPGFTGRSRWWWNLALGIQIWHFIEHSLLWLQATTGAYLLGKPVPTSIAQLIIPRVELHLFYNALVFLPIIMALSAHRVPAADDRAQMNCRCATTSPAVAR